MGGGRWRIFFHPTHPWTTSLFSPPHLILFPPTTSPTSRGNACHQVTAAKSTRQTTQKLYIFFAITLPLTPPAIHHTLSHTTTYCHPYQSLPHSTPNPVLSIFSSLVIYSSSPLHFTTCLLWNTNAQRVISAKRTTPSFGKKNRQIDTTEKKLTACSSMCQNHTHHIHTHITHNTHTYIHITSTHTSTHTTRITNITHFVLFLPHAYFCQLHFVPPPLPPKKKKSRKSVKIHDLLLSLHSLCPSHLHFPHIPNFPTHFPPFSVPFLLIQQEPNL